MASTYSDLKIELIGTGEQSGTWGVTTDTNLETALGEAITGSADVNFSSAADVTVTLTNTNTAQTARNLRLNLTESSTGVGYVGNLILGSGCQIEKLYLINNGTTGAKTIKNTTGTGITVPAGTSMFVFNNGTNVVDAITAITSGTINNTSIGATTPSTGAFTNLAYTGTLTGGTGVVNIGSGQVYKDASGNVGIGTTSPSSKLTVNGQITLNSDVLSTASSYVYSNAGGGGVRSGWLLDGTNAVLAGFTGGAEAMRIASNGFVMVGTTTTPSNSLFYVAGSSGFGIDSSSASSNNNQNGFFFQQSDGNFVTSHSNAYPTGFFASYQYGGSVAGYIQGLRICKYTVSHSPCQLLACRSHIICY